MTIGQQTQGEVGIVSATVTQGSGLKSEFIADMCADRLFSIGKTAPPHIAQQMSAFKDTMRSTILHYINTAKGAARTDHYHKLKAAGYDEAAEFLRST